MRKSLLALGILLAATAQSQTDYSGSYGYTLKPLADAPKVAKNNGPSGNLVLLKMDNKNKYRFWLDVGKGWPSYNIGATDGTITVVNDTASFDNSYVGGERTCIIHFTLSKSKVTISAGASGIDCDFGNGVYADGDYIRLKIQPVLDNDWLKTQYPQSPVAEVTSGKAEIFQDENGLVPFSPRKYFARGDSFLSIAETERTIYTEYIPSPGKFVYGWIRKTDVKTVPPEK